MNSFTDQEIRSYINLEASASLKQNIEKAIEEDADLKNHVEFLRNLMIGYESNELSTTLQSISNETPETNSKNKKTAIVFLAIIATLLSIWYFGFQNKKTNKLPQNNLNIVQILKPPNGLPTPMGDSELDLSFLDAMVDYKSKKYKAALDKWEKLNIESSSDTLQYYIGACHFAQDDYHNAITFFSSVIQDRNSAFRNSALWYQGIAEIKTGNKLKAIQLIKKSSHPDKEIILKYLGQ